MFRGTVKLSATFMCCTEVSGWWSQGGVQGGLWIADSTTCKNLTPEVKLQEKLKVPKNKRYNLVSEHFIINISMTCHVN